MRARSKDADATGKPRDSRYTNDTPPVYLQCTDAADECPEKEEKAIFDSNNNSPRQHDEDVTEQVEAQCSGVYL
jgi:hypothetical protein